MMRATREVEDIPRSRSLRLRRVRSQGCLYPCFILLELHDKRVEALYCTAKMHAVERKKTEQRCP
jgi:hypothetical protein